MRIFLYEHLSASGEISSLRTEGWAMLSALAEDFQRLPGCEVWTLLDGYCPASLGHQCHRVRESVLLGMPGSSLFRKLASKADATVVIAPETNGVLAQMAQLVIQSMGRWLGCTLPAIKLAADKKALGDLWLRNGVPTPAMVGTLDYPGFPVVLKPRDGAGSQGTFLIRDQDGWQTCWHQARQEMPAGEFVLQRFVEGHPASVAFLIGPAESALIVPLLPAAQRLSGDGRFRYLGGQLPLESALAERAVKLGRRAVQCVQGLQGYVGVDLVLGVDERGDQAIEINPRLTTSYLGLRRISHGNLAGAMWNVFCGLEVGDLRWVNGTIGFTNKH